MELPGKSMVTDAGKNRNIRRFCHEQGLHPKRLEPEDLFAPETMMFSKE